MVCHSCGNEIDENAVFCGVCGAPINCVNSNEVKATDEVKSSTIKQNSLEPEKKSKKSLIIIIAVVLVAVAAAVAFFVFKPDPTNGDGGSENNYAEEQMNNQSDAETTQDYYSNVKAEAISNADNKAQSGDYLGAIEEIESAELSVGEDSELSSKKKSYETSYINEIITKANAFIADAQYDEAKVLLNEAVSNVSDPTELNKKLKYIEFLNPVSLFAMHMIDSKGYTVNETIYVDPFGNTHDGYAHFEYVGNDQRYVIYNLKKESLTFSGSIVSCQNTGSDEVMVVKIYVDDVLKYTSPQFNKTSGVIQFDIDVKDGQQLKIKPELVSGYWGDACFNIADTKLVRDADLMLNKMDSASDTNTNSGEGYEVLYLVDSNGYEVSDETLVDAFGNSHDRYGVFTYVGNDQRYATYTVSQACNKFNGTIVPVQNTGSNEQMVVMIYVDDVLKYTSPTFGKTTEKIDFSVDIRGAKKITVKTGLASGYWGDARFALVNLGTE